MIKELIKLATHLDKKGLRKEADYLDSIIKKANKEPSASVGKIGNQNQLPPQFSEFIGQPPSDISAEDLFREWFDYAREDDIIQSNRHTPTMPHEHNLAFSAVPALRSFPVMHREGGPFMRKFQDLFNKGKKIDEKTFKKWAYNSLSQGVPRKDQWAVKKLDLFGYPTTKVLFIDFFNYIIDKKTG